MDFQIIHERPGDAPLIDPLLDRTFGIDRKHKTVYRLREGVAPLADLSFAAVHADGGMLATIRYWPILVEEAPALLLGPLAVEPCYQGAGIGKALVRHSLNEARRLGHRICAVVGEPEYYGPFGFSSAAGFGLILPGPVEPRRFQAQELRAGALEGVHGVLRRAEASADSGESLLAQA